MEKLLIFIKHRFKFLWNIIEWGNGFVFSVFYRSRLEKVLGAVFDESLLSSYVFRRLELSDAGALHDLIKLQPESDLEFFSPHDFDNNSIRKQFSNSAFLMMGVFEKEDLVGYFFLRFFANRKCFVGRLIDREHRGRGIGILMNSIMYRTAWDMRFRCLSPISNNNKTVMKAHSKNPSMIVLKELKNDYLLVEFVDKIDEESL